MTLGELKRWVDTQLEINPNKSTYDVVIPIDVPRVGGQACINVSGMGIGTDWDKGKIFIVPITKLKPNANN
jgi:hypothetical protein